MEKRISNNNLPLWLTLFVSAGLVVLLYAPVFTYFIPRWFKEDAYHHCPLVLPIVAWLFWRQRQVLSRLRPIPTLSGLLLLALGLLIYLAGARIGVRMIIGVSLPVVLFGLCAALSGWRTLKLLVIPLLITFFLVPIPRHVLGMIAFPMQIISAKSTALLGHVTGLPVVAHGVNMEMGGFTFQVAEACSGLNSLLALLLATAVLAEIMELSLIRKFLVLIAAPFLVLAANVVRLLSVLWISKFISPQIALNSLVHGTSDIIVYSIAVIFVLLLIGLLKSQSEAPRQESLWRSHSLRSPT